jgi:general secretion pathway protein H
MTARLSEPVEKGTAYIYFFPQGHAEPAIVHFVDRSEDYYSIVLHPLTGQARIYPCEYKIPKDFDVSDDKRVRSGKDPCASRGGI